MGTTTTTPPPRARPKPLPPPRPRPLAPTPRRADSTAPTDTADSAGTTPGTSDAGPATTEAAGDPLGGDGELSTTAPEVDPDGSIRFGYTLSPSQGLDPHKTSLSQDTVWLAPIYDPLIIEMPDASLVPGLATEWEFVDDNMALQLTLREGVTFQDGTPFDADAVKINIERAKTVEGSAVAPLLSAVDSVEVIDPLTAKLHPQQPGRHAAAHPRRSARDDDLAGRDRRPQPAAEPRRRRDVPGRGVPPGRPRRSWCRSRTTGTRTG